MPAASSLPISASSYFRAEVDRRLFESDVVTAERVHGRGKMESGEKDINNS